MVYIILMFHGLSVCGFMIYVPMYPSPHICTGDLIIVRLLRFNDDGLWGFHLQLAGGWKMVLIMIVV